MHAKQVFHTELYPILLLPLFKCRVRDNDSALQIHPANHCHFTVSPSVLLKVSRPLHQRAIGITLVTCVWTTESLPPWMLWLQNSRKTLWQWQQGNVRVCLGGFTELRLAVAGSKGNKFMICSWNSESHPLILDVRENAVGHVSILSWFPRFSRGGSKEYKQTASHGKPGNVLESSCQPVFRK